MYNVSVNPRVAVKMIPPLRKASSAAYLAAEVVPVAVTVHIGDV
jgi:hypothetical protein